MNVWVLNIDHQHGNNISVHATEAGAVAELYEYVSDFWEQETAREDFLTNPEIPMDQQEAIRAYFTLWTDEYYSIEEHVVLQGESR